MRSSHGFTLTELVITIVLIGILSTFAATRFARDDYDAVAAADEVVAAIRHAQVLAMEHSGTNDGDGDGNADYYGFRVNGNAFSLAIADSNGDVTAVPDPTGSGGYAQSWSSGITLATSPRSAIYFNAFGEPVDASGNSLANRTTVSVTSGSTTIGVQVEPLTGYAYR